MEEIEPAWTSIWVLSQCQEDLELAQELFAAYGVKVTTSGHKHLGSTIGYETYMDIFFQKEVQKWMCQLNILSEIALTEPHAAYCCFIHGLKSTWNYSMRTTPGTGDFLAPIEDIIRIKFIPALTGT